MQREGEKAHLNCKSAPTPPHYDHMFDVHGTHMQMIVNNISGPKDVAIKSEVKGTNTLWPC